MLFSDASHDPEAISHEATMLERYDLIDRRGFVMVWDDLGDSMTDAFLSVWERMRVRYSLPDESLQLGLVNGLLGEFDEPAHLLGVIAHVREDEDRAESAS